MAGWLRLGAQAGSAGVWVVSAPGQILIGVDPGLSGAIAALANGELIVVKDMPVVTHGSSSRRINAAELAKWLRAIRYGWEGWHFLAIVEDASTRRGQGVASSGAFLRAAGSVEGVLAALEIPCEHVASNKWKRDMGLTHKNKDASRAKAIDLFPAAPLARKKDHGRAEALLLAQWGARRLGRATMRSPA